jgi:formamidopyrimidine-DNA glycosylase
VLELPELEVIRERLRLALVGRRIVEVRLPQPALLKTTNPALAGLRTTHVGNVTRRGQHLTLSSDVGLHLDLDFTRGGFLEPFLPGQTRAPAICLALEIEDGPGICVCDSHPQPRAAAYLVTDLASVPFRADSGLDPLDPGFTLNRFRQVLGRRSRPVRHVLTDKRAIAGIGSAYADETLFAARLSPLATTSELKPETAIRLHGAVKRVLSNAILSLKTLSAELLPGERDRTFLKVHRRQGQQCLECGAVIHVVRDGHILTSYCPFCQTGGEILADRNAEPTPKPHA